VKRKKKNWDHEPWTPFDLANDILETLPVNVRPHHMFTNSIYQVSVWYGTNTLFGDVAHLSIKTHDKQARHDWRDMQRIKNELCGSECEAIEIFPAESRVVDTANQYHLYVFQTFKIPLGFNERLVADGPIANIPHTGRQRPWRPEFRPADVLSEEEIDKRVQAFKGSPSKSTAHVCCVCRQGFGTEHTGHSVNATVWYCSPECQAKDASDDTQEAASDEDAPY